MTVVIPDFLRDFLSGELAQSVILDSRLEVDENCALLGHYAATSGNCSLTFRNNL